MQPDARRRSPEERLDRVERQLARGLTFEANLRATVARFDELYGDDVDVDIRLDPGRGWARPLGVLCLEVATYETNIPGSIGGSVPWEYVTREDGSEYARIRNLPGLSSSVRYRATFAVVGG